MTPSINNPNNYNTFNKPKSKKDVAIAMNPCKIIICKTSIDSGKKYEFGDSHLEHNPITNPVNSYNYENNRLRQANNNAVNVVNAMNALNSVNLREVASGRNGKR